MTVSESERSPGRAAPRTDIIFRPARPSDGYYMALCATTAYRSSPVTAFLAPKHAQYPRDFIESFARRYRLAPCQPNRMTLVAVDPTRNDKIIGVGLLSREGTDPGRQALIRRQTSIRQTVMYWYYSLLGKLLKWWWPDRHENPEAARMFMEEDVKQQKMWDQMYPNRWHCRSLTVHPEYQGRGIGSHIMGVFIEVARKEGLPIALEASAKGEFLYRKLGFRLVSRFGLKLAEEEERSGGLMVYEPDTMDPAYLKR